MKWGKALLLPVICVLLLELASQTFGISSDVLAAPSSILVSLWQALLDGSLLTATAETFYSAIVGLLVGGGLGLLTCIPLGLFPTASQIANFSVEAFRPIPAIALVPVALMVFGFGFRMEVSIVAFACFWPILLLGRAAIAGIEPRLIEVSRVLRFGLFARVVKIVLPAALPRLFVAVRLAAGIALIVAVTVEIAANPIGLGYALMMAQQTLRPDLMFANLIWVGFIGWTLNALLLTAQRRLFGNMQVAERSS